MSFCNYLRAILALGIAAATGMAVQATETRPASPGFTAPRPTAEQAKKLAASGRLPAAPRIVIRGTTGKSIPTTNNRFGITHHGSTSEFPKTAMARQMDGSLPHTRKFGDGTVKAGADRTGITHATKTFPYGAEVGTLRTGWSNSGLTTQHTQGRVWAGFRKGL